MKDLKFKDEDGNLAMTVFEKDEDGFINFEYKEGDVFLNKEQALKLSEFITKQFENEK